MEVLKLKIYRLCKSSRCS